MAPALTFPPEARETWAEEPRESSGFYSRTDEQVESLSFPKPPRVPSVLAAVEEALPFSGMHSDGRYSVDRHGVEQHGVEQHGNRDEVMSRVEDQADGLPTKPASAPPPSSDGAWAMQGDWFEDASEDQQTAAQLSTAGGASGREVTLTPRLRRKAQQWLMTGALMLPASWSARHARAMQRAMLLALLDEPGWQSLPEGMQQRAAWLFRDGWSAGAGRRDADDLMTVLQLPSSAQARASLEGTVARLLHPVRRVVASRRPSRPPAVSR